MFNSLLAQLFKAPFMTSNGIHHPREALTPGHLYRLMSAEFRAFRNCGCACVMPMVFTAERTERRACNWDVRPVSSGCASCQLLADEIVARHAAVYDVNDPTYSPPPAGDETHASGFPLFS